MLCSKAVLRESDGGSEKEKDSYNCFKAFLRGFLSLFKAV